MFFFGELQRPLSLQRGDCDLQWLSARGYMRIHTPSAGVIGLYKYMIYDSLELYNRAHNIQRIAVSCSAEQSGGLRFRLLSVGKFTLQGQQRKTTLASLYDT